MKVLMTSALLCALVQVVAPPVLHARHRSQAPTAGQPPATSADSKNLVYADFERTENNRPVSSRGGLIQLFSYQESDVHKSTSTRGSKGRTRRRQSWCTSRRTIRTTR